MIHYHGLPLSGDRLTTIRAMQSRHAFVSFAEPTCVDIAAEICQSFAFDNGAYTAWKQGKTYDIEEYASWVHKWCKHPGFDWYVMPDVIDGTADENMRMLATWSKLVGSNEWAKGAPVWHLHEPIEVLRSLVYTHSRVCFGSSAQYAEVGSSIWWDRMAEAMLVACDEDGMPHCKLHGLRMLNPTIFSHLPLSSADSTNVARNIGIDGRWNGPYAPKSNETRALLLMERIECHASAARWGGTGVGAQPNMELFG